MTIYTQTFLFVGMLFLGIGAYAWQRKEPMWFWSGTQVDPDTVSDIKAYNRANAAMWAVYSLPYWLGALLHRSHPQWAYRCITFATTIGVLLLIGCYLLIRRKYRKR